MITDQQRQENILKLLPEKGVRDLLDELSNGHYSEKSQKMMAEKLREMPGLGDMMKNMMG